MVAVEVRNYLYQQVMVYFKEEIPIKYIISTLSADTTEFATPDICSGNEFFLDRVQGTLYITTL